MRQYSLLASLLWLLFIRCVDCLSPQHNQQHRTTTSVDRRGTSRRAFVLEQTLPVVFGATAFHLVSPAGTPRSPYNKHILHQATTTQQHGSDCSCIQCMTGGGSLAMSSVTVPVPVAYAASFATIPHGQDCSCTSCNPMTNKH